jgi:hypothetical protein
MNKYELGLVVHCDDKEWSENKSITFMVSMGISSQRASQLLKDLK